MPLSSNGDNSAIYTDPATWRPNMPASELFEEKTWLQGAILSAVAYGVVATLFFLDLSLLLNRVVSDSGRWTPRKRQNVALITYVCAMFILSTLTVASQAQMTQLGFIDNRNFPGGPALFQDLMFSIPISLLGNVCFTIMNWFSDCLLLWRCLVIYRSSQASLPAIMALPSVLLLASFAFGVVYLVKVDHPGASPYTTMTFTLVYSIISLGLNVLLTIMIVIRLFLHRRRVVKAIGTRHGSQYTGIIAMLIESAFLLDVVVLWFLITFVLGSPVANIPLSTLVHVTTISSFMIIFRVASGTAWASNTVGELLSRDIRNRVAELSVIEFSGTALESGTAIGRPSATLDGHRIHPEKRRMDEDVAFPPTAQRR